MIRILAFLALSAAACLADAPVRKIDQRWGAEGGPPPPNVKGIDLCQAYNYIDLDDTGRDFIYDRYTSTTLTYVKGSRPQLEAIVEKVCAGIDDPMKRAVALVNWMMAENMLWSSDYWNKTGTYLPTDRNLTEEELIESGFGWCNEQARVLCALAQVAGIPSRLVFASNATNTSGHVISELYVPGGWMMVDQTLGACFIRDGKPVNAWEMMTQPAVREYFSPLYGNDEDCGELIQAIGAKALNPAMRIFRRGPNFFEKLGYCNHFI